MLSILKKNMRRILNAIEEKYPLRRELRYRKNERRNFYLEAKERFENDKPVHGSLEDYRNCLYSHRFSYEEYMNRYKLWGGEEANLRDEILSERELWCIYRKLVQPEVRRVFSNKVLTLQMLDEFVHRRWLLIGNYPGCQTASFDEFVDLVGRTECIVKPVGGECGKGIFKLSKRNCIELNTIYDNLVSTGYIVEECVHACDEIESFHPASLNTLRVLTMSNGRKSIVLGAVIRMGANGSVIDNISAGGIAAPIDVKTGVIIGGGIDAHGRSYDIHPTSNKTIKGTVIPHWDEVLHVCETASLIIPNTVIAGWDICILPTGQVELIEANSAPDIRSLQLTTRKGIKKQFQSYGKELYGVDFLSLIAVWSKSYKYGGLKPKI